MQGDGRFGCIQEYNKVIGLYDRRGTIADHQLVDDKGRVSDRVSS